MFADHGEGSHAVDVDGNEFMDYLIGLGPMMLGHRSKEITDAVVHYITNVGTVFALAGELDGIVAEKVCDAVSGMDKVRFVNSGTEAVIYALRLARIDTGRNKIVRFEGMYHGFRSLSRGTDRKRHRWKKDFSARREKEKGPAGPFS